MIDYLIALGLLAIAITYVHRISSG